MILILIMYILDLLLDFAMDAHGMKSFQLIPVSKYHRMMNHSSLINTKSSFFISGAIKIEIQGVPLRFT